MLTIIENKWDIKYIQILPEPTVGATENIGEGLLFSKYKLFLLDQANSSLIHLKYWYQNSSYLELPCLPHHVCQILPQPTFITTAQLHSTKPELRFSAGSNPARGVSEIRVGEDLWQWSRLEVRLNAFRRLTIPQKQFNSYASLFFPNPCDRTPPQVLNMPNHLPSQAN